jgi:hypothetical protein
MLFTFAGSSHSKYTNYLLETLCNLELESGPALREAILRSTLVSLSGKPGSFTAADLMQEYFNRLLEAIVEKKGVEYGDTFIREVVSPNLHHFARIKLDLRDGVGLAKRSGRHTEPHMKPEVKILLETYAKCELHCRRPGRAYNEIDKDDFTRGLTKLRTGKLKKWITDTTRNRGLRADVSFPNSDRVEDVDHEDVDHDEDEPAEEESASEPQTWGYMEVIDGELIFGNTESLSFDIDEWMSQLEDQAMHVDEA